MLEFPKVLSRIISGSNRTILIFYIETGRCPSPRKINLASSYPHKFFFWPVTTWALIGRMDIGLPLNRE